ncbi:MAG: RDD family protein [Candidatus Sumerlaeaceae bacterium]
MITRSRIRQLDEYTLVIDRIAPGPGVIIHRVAGLGSRFLATIYDLFIESVLFAWLASALWQANVKVPAIAWAVGFVLWDVVYHLVFELFAGGQTPGKNVVGIFVLSWDGTTPRTWQILTRNILRLIDFLPFVYFAGGIRALLSSPCMRWGDQLSRTVVADHESYPHQLFRVRSGTAAFNTSPDAYLLESYILRAEHLDPQFAKIFAEKLARYFMERYELGGERELAELYGRGRFDEFLRLLYWRERSAAAESSVHDDDKLG